MNNKKPLCNKGDKFYRIFKNRVIEVTIERVEQMPLGHYIYQDDFRPYSTVALHRTFCKRYFKDKELAEKVVELKTKISALREELDIENCNLRLLLEENEEQIKGEKN